MKRIHILSLILIAILIVAFATFLASYVQSSDKSKAPVYVGIAYGGNTTTEAKLVIDRVKTYTNLFILDSGINPISANKSAVKEICDYAVNAGLNIIVNLGTWVNWTDWHWRIQFLNQSKQTYGSKFLGAYYDDEPAGIPLDWDWNTYWTTNSSLFSGIDPLTLIPIHYRVQLAEITGQKPDSYSPEAEWVHQLMITNKGHISLNQNNIKTFTSDYALYWYDYLGGYDTLFAQIGLNQTVVSPDIFQHGNDQTSLALLRGAATLQNRDWGAIITWKYDQPPPGSSSNLDTGQNVYHEMVTAYNAGAKYITIFDYTKTDGNPYGGMDEEHFRALHDFWTNVVTKTPPTTPYAQAVLVLPKDYGFGMRKPDDRIWGFWGPDDKTPLIWENTQRLLSQYGLGMDIVYEDSAFPLDGNYSKVYYWNQTIT